MIYLYGNGSSDNDDQAAKVRIAYSRERDDRGRGEKAEGEWTCKIVRYGQARQAYGITKTSSAHLSTSQAVQNVTGVRHHRSVGSKMPEAESHTNEYRYGYIQPSSSETSIHEQWRQRCFTQWHTFAIPSHSEPGTYSDGRSPCQRCGQAIQTRPTLITAYRNRIEKEQRQGCINYWRRKSRC